MKGDAITGCSPTHCLAIPQPRPTTGSLGSFVIRHHPTLLWDCGFGVVKLEDGGRVQSFIRMVGRWSIWRGNERDK